MTARSLRYTSLQLTVLGCEIVCISLASFVLGQRADFAILWLPLFVAGGGLLLWSRLLLWRDLWQRPWGRLAVIAGATTMGALLVRAVAPQEVASLLSPTVPRSFALSVRYALTTAPLVIGTLAGLAVAARVLLLLRKPLTLHRATTRLTASLVAMVVILALARSRGEPPPGSEVVIFFVCALLALALARAHELARLPQAGGLPFNGRWLLNLLLGVGLVVGLGALVGAPLVPGRFAFLGEGAALIQRGWVWAMSYLLRFIFWVLVPAVEWLIELVRDLVIDVVLPTLQWLLGLNQNSPDLERLNAGQLRWLRVALVSATTVVVLLALYTLYRLVQLRDAESETDIAEVEAGTGEMGWRDWLRHRRAALRHLLRRLLRPTFGVETVRDLYRNLLQFGDAHDLPRPAEDTPYEYLEPLCRRYPARADDFLLLTDAYVAARYGERDFDREDVQQLRAAWYRIEGEEERQRRSRQATSSRPGDATTGHRAPLRDSRA